ncbi:MAG: response regulator [Candidatus Viridilinea halotolerans]|uniref:histidine kinase n=1 Tax=Candidatus Viridilinea halotolerans TaxID=2491704 RepID=A0A426TZY6_9CHLR|nr:MAG: response regulator [Candidatus Viridilinea halotolerans]
MAGEHILIVEDEAVIAMDMQGLLERLGYQVPIITGDAEETFAAVRVACPDLVLLDINLGNGPDGISVAEELQRLWQVPVIFLTAHADAATVGRAKAVQPYHYLLKPFAERELAIAVELALLKSKSDRALRASEQRFATTLRAIADGVVVADGAGQLSFMNPVAAQLTGWPLAEALDRPLAEVLVGTHEESGEQLAAMVAQILQTTHAPDQINEMALISRDGTRRNVSVSLAPLSERLDRVNGVVIVLRDETERRRLAEERRAMEHKLLETQRRESLGLLAGGIAHDFNNLLSVVQGQIDLAMLDLTADHPIYPSLQQAFLGLRRAADLAGQMLAYSGRGHMLMEELQINDLVDDVVTLLRGNLAKRTQVELHLAAGLPAMHGDATQVRQVVMNLLTNAAEAFTATDGVVKVTTSAVRLTPAALANYIHGEELSPGRFIALEVCDGGCGMDGAILARIFDPFFSTKRTGRGLGLAAVQGIVRGHGGAMHVASSPGEGSCFRVIFPALLAAELSLKGPQHDSDPATPKLLGGNQGGTLLVVDDEAGVRTVLTRYLERMGFKVVSAESGLAALDRLANGIPHLRGMLVDLTMPGMSGDQLATHVRRIYPGTPIMIMSGYRAEEIAAQYANLELKGFLQKPFRYDTLSAALVVMLD